MSEPEPGKGPLSEQTAKKFNIAFTRAPFFRTVQVDGSWGRISPAGLIHLSLFNDCGPLPAIAKHNIEPDGKLSEEMTLIGPEGVNMALIGREAVNIVRQIEVDVVLSLEAARAVRNNLDNFIKILEAEKKPSQS